MELKHMYITLNVFFLDTSIHVLAGHRNFMIINDP